MTSICPGTSPNLSHRHVAKPAQADRLGTAVFGAGCFWGPELAFQRVPGVVATATGYSQVFT